MRLPSLAAVVELGTMTRGETQPQLEAFHCYTATAICCCYCHWGSLLLLPLAIITLTYPLVIAKALEELRLLASIPSFHCFALLQYSAATISYNRRERTCDCHFNALCSKQYYKAQVCSSSLLGAGDLT